MSCETTLNTTKSNTDTIKTSTDTIKTSTDTIKSDTSSLLTKVDAVISNLGATPTSGYTDQEYLQDAIILLASLHNVIGVSIPTNLTTLKVQ